MTPTDLPALREVVAETIPYCGQGETVPNAWARRERAERILLDAVPALLDELEAANAALETAYKEGFNTAQYYCAGKHSHGTPDAAWQAWPGRQR